MNKKCTRSVHSYGLCCSIALVILSLVIGIKPSFAIPHSQVSKDLAFNKKPERYNRNQGHSISVKFEAEPLDEVLKILARKADIGISYKSGLIPDIKITYIGYEKPVFKVLEAVLKGIDLYAVFSENKKAIFIKKRQVPAETRKLQHMVKGKVTDAKTGKSLPGVNILVKGTYHGTNTDKNGRYSLEVNDGTKAVLRFSFVGYKTKEVKVNNRDTLNVALQPAVAQIEDMVVTGIVERNEKTFTGAATRYSGQELKQIGTKNVIKSLEAVDPSFQIITNNKFGSNPNRLPQVEVRGRSSIDQENLRGRFDENPNLPLFILDGFPSGLQTIVNLDMNRVESVTILKDASSTAMYGAKAANGVVVVKTKSPEVGDMRVSYSFDTAYNFADLSSYNLMNSKQKLEYERLAEHYESVFSPNNVFLHNLYNQRLYDVQRGLYTDWLRVPVRKSLTQKHSLSVHGGSKVFRYGVGMDYQKIPGVMKGSARNKWGGSLDLTYNKGRLNIQNKTYVQNIEAKESPYGELSDFAELTPYSVARNSNGEMNRYLFFNPKDADNTASRARYAGDIIANPLYNAQLNNKDRSNELEIRNNIQAKITLNKHMWVRAGVEVAKSNEDHIVFIPPENTEFDFTDFDESGEYQHGETNELSYQANLTYTYANVFKKYHSLTFNFRTDVQQETDKFISFESVGFPENSNINPSFSAGYKPGGLPGSSYKKFRRNSFLGTMNYSYKEKYFLDATYRLDGSTAFGSSQSHSPFWAVGAGWNINEEKFTNTDIFNTLRIKGNIGVTGNQNFGSTSSTSVYAFNEGTNVFGQSLSIDDLGNQNLAWQKTRQISLGLDVVVLNNRASLTLNAYNKHTNNLIINLDLGPSTGISDYSLNGGELITKGLEAKVRFSPIYHISKKVIWSIGATGEIVRSHYTGLGNLYGSLNDELLQGSSLYQYKNGHRPNDIWLKGSVGIDPATGKEVFLKENGDYTFDYDEANIRDVGNTRPTLQGVVNTNVTYKRFQFGTYLKYSFGGDKVNSKLYNKVENISNTDVIYNHDVRALTSRWKKPGDVTKFKAINSFNDNPITSRFVQKNNYIMAQTIRLGYRVNSSANWINEVGLKYFRFNIYLNNIFRFSTSKRERGINYPFARSITANVSISF